MSDPEDDETVILYGGAKPGDDCFADVVAVDHGPFERSSRRTTGDGRSL